MFERTEVEEPEVFVFKSSTVRYRLCNIWQVLILSFLKHKMRLEYLGFGEDHLK